MLSTPEFLLLDLVSSDTMEKVRGFVEDSAKTMFSNDSITINLWPWLVAGFFFMLGRSLSSSHLSS